MIYGKSRSLFIRYAKKTLAYVSRPLRSWARPLSLSGPVRRAALRIKPDVIHVHDLVPLYAAVSTASETDSKVIYDAHELELHRVGRKGIHRLLAGMHERYAIRYVERVITVCDSIADYLRDHYRIKRPLVILNSPNIDADCDNKGDIRSAAGVEPGIPLVVYVGKITIHRGLEEVLRAVSLWTDGHFAMVGPVHEETRRQLKALTVDLGIEDRVRFIDSVSPDCVVDFISSADIGIIATQDASLSYRFSLPNKLFEMTLAGLVLCASDLPEHRRYLSEFGNGILMDQAEPEKIASAIKYAWKNIDELKPDAEKLAEIRENYGWGRQAAKLADLYSTLGNV